MFIYLSKKIAIPNCANLRAVAWNNDAGYIACGGDDGLLKVLKLESNTSPNQMDPPKGVGSQLSMNQTLEGHNGSLLNATWNRQHQKLTTSDSNGLIIVWILYKGMWYEEMINNRNKGLVTGMEWNKTGEKICIVYEDGAVILGSVDGNRIWGKELKNTNLAHVQWSPDGKFLLFGTASGQLQLFDNQGVIVCKLSDFCHPKTDIKIAAIDWYNGSRGYIQPNVPCLAICYDDGKVQILRNQKDTKPIKFDTTMKFIKMQWNVNGSILAISGIQFIKNNQGEEKETCMVQFWNPYGHFLRSIKVPGKRISSISWESDGLRIALAVDSFIYFANIRPDYRWTFFAKDIVVYAFNKADHSDCNVVFWNVKSNEKTIRTIDKLISIKSSGEHCLLITQNSLDQNQFILTVYNAIGTPIESKFIDFEPKFSSISKSHVVVASAEIVLHWQFKNHNPIKSSTLDAIRKRDIRERSFHIDEVTAAASTDVTTPLSELSSRHASVDPITCITTSESLLIITRQSGSLLQFLIPTLVIENKYSIPINAVSLSLNSNSSRLSILDTFGVLKLFELEKVTSSGARGLVGSANAVANSITQKFNGGTLLEFERKDVWDIQWADDNPEMFSIMEKTRLYIFKNLDPEEPLSCSGYLCTFGNLEVKTILLDDVMQEPESPNQSFLVILETKWLRDLRGIIATNGLTEAFQFAEDRPHQRLWKAIADEALSQLKFDIATKAFVRCQNYQGIQFIKRLNKLDDPIKQKAEIAAFCCQFEAAEKLYLEMDRKDLAVDLRIRMGDWFRVVQLIKTGGGGDDILLEEAWNHIGDYYYERQRWSQAITYYIQGRNTEKLVEIYYILEDFEGLEKLAKSLSENSPFLKNIAEKFVSVGLSEPAFNAYMKIGDITSAVNACVYLNQWNTAVELAEIHHFKEIEGLLMKYATYILSRNKKKEAIELYRKANMCQKSAKILFELAHDAIKSHESPINIKKLFVLGALEVERYHSIQKSSKPNALEGLLTEDLKSISESKVLDKAWRGAEAYHFYCLAQRQFYQGQLESAVITAMRLQSYDDIIDPETIYSLLALVSLQARYYKTCSKALVKLEGIDGPNKEYYSELAFSIFTKYKPHDPEGETIMCSNCLNPMKESDSTCSSCQVHFPSCIASGRPLVDSMHFMCHVCKHRAIESEINSFSFCPLCHTTL
ncbi:WD repeat-containing protein 35-like protein [Globomyces pollinis-pini]|nr:WD repeat-containing protein 35-like protein [Globomyces pollinis-pini]